MPECEVGHTQNTVFPHPGAAAEPSRFIGRQDELTVLQRLQTTTRHLTLVGPGGVGKSRLAARLSTTVQHRFSHGVWFVDLAPRSDPAELVEAMLNVVGIPQRPGQDLLQSLVELLRDRQVMLFLDNCEQVISAIAEITARLLRTCPDVHVLATSREPLGIEGEVVWRVPPLSQPPVEVVELAQLEVSEAVLLFVARVRERIPDFSLTPANAADVVRICRNLGGLPLALELVATRVHRVSLHRLATRLDPGAALAWRGGRGRPPRQRTLRATLDWSYRLLSAPERLLLRRLAVFSGGWTLAAAEAVCTDDNATVQDIADDLSQLVTRSLVQAEQVGDGSFRYGFLDTTRAYAAEQLEATGGDAGLRARHATYMLGLAERTLPDANGAAHASRLADELDNLRVALRWAANEQHTELGRRLAIVTGRLLLSLGTSALWRGDLPSARIRLDEAAERLPRVDSPAELVSAAVHLRALIAARSGTGPAALRLIDQALDRERRLDDLPRLRETLAEMGNARLNVGRIDETLPSFRAAAELAAAAGERLSVIRVLEGVDYDARPRNVSLTRREAEVVHLLVRGLSTKQIADQLSISPATVRTHLDHVMAKFDLHSRVQLVAWARRDAGG
jgi:predicted ATPase/DNA-binding CsgD family transcriptional regulator